MQLHRLRARGRTTSADRLGGLVIEHGEPEALLDEIRTEPEARCGNTTSALAVAVPTFQHAQRVYGLTDLERDALLVALAPEIDGRFARLFGYFNDSVISFRPTVGLLATLLAPTQGPAAMLSAFVPDGPLARYTLASLSGGAIPLAGQTVTLASSWWPRLVGLGPDGSRPIALALEALVAGAALRSDAERVAAWWRERPTGLLIIEGPAGSGREALVRAIAARADLPVVPIVAGEHGWPTASEIARDARWRAGIAVLTDAPDEIAQASVKTDARLAIVSERVTAVSLTGLDRPVRLLRVRGFELEQRRELWRRAAPEVSSADNAVLASRFRLGPARIAEVVHRARDVSQHPHALATLVGAAADASALRFDGLASRVEPNAGPLIVPNSTRRELATANAWATHRRTVFDRDAIGGHLQLAPGLVCLFWGPPGTGKTLAARQIAKAADVDLYRVDLAQVVSKYIGETEKRLAALLDECERSDVAILFDEADALFGKRTAVKDAHDRYANIETGFLLQRLETTTALVILTSNLRDNLDAAFARRLHVVAEFPPPGPEERAALWRHMLPSAALVGQEVDIDLLARSELRGGDIRNAIAAALVSAEAHEPARLMQFLVWGVWRELQKAGRLVAATDFGRWEALVHRLGRGGSPAE